MQLHGHSWGPEGSPCSTTVALAALLASLLPGPIQVGITFMAWIHKMLSLTLPKELSHPNGIGLPNPGWQKGHTVKPHQSRNSGQWSPEIYT